MVPLKRQVKIHGHRIELDEVHHALTLDGSAVSAAVLVRATGRHGERSLVAFVTPMEAGWSGIYSTRLGLGLRVNLKDR